MIVNKSRLEFSKIITIYSIEHNFQLDYCFLLSFAHDDFDNITSFLIKKEKDFTLINLKKLKKIVKIVPGKTDFKE